jgi:hypothetical protein
MVSTCFERRVLAAVFACAAFAACESEPVVVVGQAKAMNAGHSGEMAGQAGSDQEADEKEHDDFAEHECTELEPVCGSDGMTYQNTCEATNAGVQVVRRGAC